MVELASLEKRSNELNTLLRRLYKDNVLGKVTNEQFRMLSDGYNTEQREIAKRLPIVNQGIEDLKAAATNVERFVEIANKYTDLRELTPEVLRTFIERIVIHERSAKHSKYATQQIPLYRQAYTPRGLLKLKTGKDGQSKLSVLQSSTAYTQLMFL